MTNQPTPYRTDLRRVAVRNLAVLHRAVTPEAVREEEVDRLTRADRMAGCLGDVGLSYGRHGIAP